MNSESAEYFLHELFSRAGKQEKNYFMTSEQQRRYLPETEADALKGKQWEYAAAKPSKL